MATCVTWAPGQTTAADTLLAGIEQKIAEQTNRYRDRHGLTPLSEDVRLHKSARRFADFMAGTGRYGHRADGNTPSQRVQHAEYEPCTVRENIGLLELAGLPSAEDIAARLMAGWLGSTGHRRNIEAKDITQIGIGLASVAENTPAGKPKHIYAVQLMAMPRDQAYRFSVRNTRGQTVRYTIDDQSFDLPPNTTHTHLRCIQPLIKATLGGEMRAYSPTSGEVIEF